jgi:predicted esterase
LLVTSDSACLHSLGEADTTIPCAEAPYGALETFDYDVTFRGFAEGHEIPAEVLREVETWIGE